MSNNALDEFRKLLEIGETLMGPGGCAWDREQTLVSLRSSVLEEACEVIEAIDNEDDDNLAEELGDLLYQVIFLSMVAEKENRFSLKMVINLICEKLIHRHPHVFGDKELHTADEVLKQWEEIKRLEKSDRISILDGIPKGLPALVRAYKIAKKIKDTSFAPEEAKIEEELPHFFETEEELGELLWDLVKRAKRRGLHPEHALRKVLVAKEAAFRDWEGSHKTTPTPHEK